MRRALHHPRAVITGQGRCFGIQSIRWSDGHHKLDRAGPAVPDLPMGRDLRFGSSQRRGMLGFLDLGGLLESNEAVIRPLPPYRSNLEGHW